MRCKTASVLGASDTERSQNAATQGKKPSVVQIRADDVNPDVIGKQVVVALHQMMTELEDGALLTVDPIRTRLRVLPLQPRE